MDERVPPKPPKPRGRRRASDPEAKRRTIAAAALEIFSSEGFAAARLDDVAAKAGVAKGTLYLYFEHKDALFEYLIRSATAPVLDRAEEIVAADIPFERILAGFYKLAHEQVLCTERRLVLRLMLNEGRRFPAIAEFYHREVITRGLGLLRCAASRAVARGETQYGHLIEFPHLAIAPVLLAVQWDGLFSRFEPLDAEKMLQAQCALLARPEVLR